MVETFVLGSAVDLFGERISQRSKLYRRTSKLYFKREGSHSMNVSSIRILIIKMWCTDITM